MLVIFFVSIVLSMGGQTLAAEDLELPNTIITPDKYLLYSFKRLMEKGIVFTKFSKDAKANYYTDLMTKRIAELKYVVENELGSEVERSTQRLSYQIGTLSDYITSNKQELDKKRQPLKELLIKYKELLANLRDHYPANSSFWMLVQHNINSIDLNLEKLK